MPDEEARIALFIDHENLVIGAREIGRGFDVGPIMDALAERGRVVARRAYADWTLFAGDRRTLVEHNCELIDIPQRTGAVRKNAADIKLAVDAMELASGKYALATYCPSIRCVLKNGPMLLSDSFIMATHCRGMPSASRS